MPLCYNTVCPTGKGRESGQLPGSTILYALWAREGGMNQDLNRTITCLEFVWNLVPIAIGMGFGIFPMRLVVVHRANSQCFQVRRKKTIIRIYRCVGEVIIPGLLHDQFFHRKPRSRLQPHHVHTRWQPGNIHPHCQLSLSSRFIHPRP